MRLVASVCVRIIGYSRLDTLPASNETSFQLAAAVLVPVHVVCFSKCFRLSVIVLRQLRYTCIMQRMEFGLVQQL